MNILDWLLVVVTLSYGISGYWRGFVTGASATAGLLLGGVLGIAVVPHLLGGLQPSVGVSLGALVVVLVAASVGQAIGAFLGSRIRDQITWRPARSLDKVGGAALSMAAVLCIAWALGYALSGARLPGIGDEVRGSTVLERIDAVMPDSAVSVLGAFNRVVDSSLFPRYLEPFATERIVDVPAPSSRLLHRPAVQGASASVVKVLGDATSCDRRIEGSGFVYASGRVMTNAHVVAGVTDPTVSLAGHTYDAQVVVYDPQLDVAVLAVDGLSARSLRFAGPVESGSSAVVLGYPQDGPFDAEAARVRAKQQLSSPDIYDDGTVTREVYSIRSLVRSGNSGGPLLSPHGRVLGVVFAASLANSSTGYALTAAQVGRDADSGRSATTAVSTGGCV